jgi:16S rRNA (guanine(966)-N(2))-methyltransferase RsmD
VISGEARGKTLTAPKGLAVRPTTDKVKGAIFSMLAAQAFQRADEGHEGGAFPYRRVLDLCAGTGALGIEALSRGSEHADFVETNPRARAAIHDNLKRTGFEDRATVHAVPAMHAVSTFRTAYDLILLDPPYEDPAIPALLDSLGRSGVLAPGGLLVLEHARGLAVPELAGRLRLTRTRFHGDTAISLYAMPNLRERSPMGEESTALGPAPS